MAGVGLEKYSQTKLPHGEELAWNLEFLRMYYISFGFLPGLRHKV